MSLQPGLDALKLRQYPEAIQLLEQFCRNSAETRSNEYIQAQMGLVQAYNATGQTQKAIALCRQLSASGNSQAASWATKALESLNQAPSNPVQKAGRAAQTGVKLAMAAGGNLALASGVTISLLFGMVLVLIVVISLIANSDNPTLGLGIGVVITLVFNTAVFFISPWIMDLVQGWLYKTRWVTLGEIASKSPETAQVIQRVCQQKNLKEPRLGIIDDQNPTAFTYGALPNGARLVVSQGLFTYLDDDEIATVYAHELGHIVHWDFAVMTVASTLVQVCYLIYSFASNLGKGGGDSKVKDAAGTAALVAYCFYVIGTYLVLYLSRTREYFADHFAAETTGNPNALSRALVKIAYGIVEEGERTKQPSKLIEGTRALGIYDHKAAAGTGNAYRVAAEPSRIGRVFLWDIFNPWGWWMELNSTHPLTGKRVRALSTYAEKMGIEVEFDMARVVQEGKSLDKGRLYGSFIFDVAIYNAPIMGFLGGIIAGFILTGILLHPGWVFAAPFFGLGAGILVKTLVMFPNYDNAPAVDVLSLMSDPYASPLRGKPAKLNGNLIGRGDAGYAFGSDLKLQDKTGLMYLRYASRFGSLGNFFFGMKKVQGLVGMQVTSLGWFRRGVAPWVDLIQLTSDSGTVVNSYHRFWSFILAGLSIIVGVVVLGLSLAP